MINRQEKVHFEAGAKLGRLIGRELITNNTIAIFELIKNSYDAFSLTANIQFVNFSVDGSDTSLVDNRHNVISNENSHIIISDKGIGMSFAEIQKYWMRIGTNSKEGMSAETRKIRGVSNPVTRMINGEKGIGRFGCDKIGSKLLLTSIGAEGYEKTTLQINWNDFDDNTKMIQDVNFSCNIETLQVSESTGVTLDISSLRDYWTGDDIIKLKRQLKKMISPFAQEQNDFSIYVDINGKIERIENDSLNYANTYIEVRLSAEGMLFVNIQDSLNKTSTQEKASPPIFGPVTLKILYMDRAAKINFRRRTGLSPREYGNIKLFRDDFRVLPYGEAENDWLGIDNIHAQEMFRTFGTRDIVGYVQITKIHNPKLKDATNRQGLNEDIPEFEQFKLFIWNCIKMLEDYIFNRIRTESEKEGKIIEGKVEDIKLTINDFQAEIPRVMREAGLSNEQMAFIGDRTNRSIKLIAENIEQVQQANNQLASRLRVMEKIVGAESMLYDILHAIKNKLAALEAVLELYIHNAERNNIPFDSKYSKIAIDDIKKMIMAALKRTSPTRTKQTVIILSEFIDTYISEKSLVYPDLLIEHEWNDNFQRVRCNLDGLKIVFDNLVDNSMKVLKEKEEKKIAFRTYKDKDDRFVQIIYEDNGPGISDSDAPFVFNTSFSRTGGTGIGLSTTLHYMKEQSGDISLLAAKNDIRKLEGAAFILKLPAIGGLS
jgi:signal transduction histidine kinase